jgi:hypothetical protein
MGSIDVPRRQFLRQTGALATAAAVLNRPLLTQAFAAQPGEEIAKVWPRASQGCR